MSGICLEGRAVRARWRSDRIRDAFSERRPWRGDGQAQARLRIHSPAQGTRGFTLGDRACDVVTARLRDRMPCGKHASGLRPVRRRGVGIYPDTLRAPGCGNERKPNSVNGTYLPEGFHGQV